VTFHGSEGRSSGQQAAYFGHQVGAIEELRRDGPRRLVREVDDVQSASGTRVAGEGEIVVDDSRLGAARADEHQMAGADAAQHQRRQQVAMLEGRQPASVVTHDRRRDAEGRQRDHDVFVRHVLAVQRPRGRETVVKSVSGHPSALGPAPSQDR
jgi:hypothetical protein